MQKKKQIKSLLTEWISACGRHGDRTRHPTITADFRPNPTLNLNARQTRNHYPTRALWKRKLKCSVILLSPFQKNLSLKYQWVYLLKLLKTSERNCKQINKSQCNFVKSEMTENFDVQGDGVYFPYSIGRIILIIVFTMKKKV